MTYAKFAGEGEKPKQESVWTSPLDIRRTNTDVRFIIAFCIFIAIWISISIYAYCEGDTFKVHYTNALHHLEVYDFFVYFSYCIYEARFLLSGFITLSVLLLILFISLFRWVTKAFVCITLFLVTLLLVLLYTSIFYGLFYNYLSFMFLLPLVVIAIWHGMLMHSVVKAGTQMICKVIRDSSKAMFFFPSTLVFAVIQFSLLQLVTIYAASIFLYLMTITESVYTEETTNQTTIENGSAEINSSDDTWFLDDPFYSGNVTVPYYIYFLHLINTCGYFWVSGFIMGMGRMVLVSTFATWYHTKDKSLIPITTMPKSLIRIIRYHTGTIAYGSSIALIAPMSYIIRKHCRDRLKEMYKRPILVISWLTILTNLSFEALSMCAMYGHNFYKSAKESYILLMKNPVSYLAMDTLSEYVILLGSLLVPMLTCLAATGYSVLLSPMESISANVTAIIIITYTSLLMSITVFTVFRAAANTIRFCYIEDCKFGNEGEMNLYEIQVDQVSINTIID